MVDLEYISIIIPTYNRYHLLQRAITSLYAQTYSYFEIIVVDDGSTDATAKIAIDFPEVRYFYQKNKGVSSARNFGIQKAKYDWIAFLDADDEWEREKLQKQIAFHQKYDDVLMSYTNERWIRNEKEVALPKKYQKYGGDIFKECLSHCIIAPSATMMHKSLLDEVGVFDENLEVCEDYDLWLRVASKHKIGLIDEKLITKYGGHQDQLSMKFWGMDRFRIKALEKLLMQNLSKTQKDLVIAMLLKKYELLLKGAIKYDKIQDIQYYQSKIEHLKKGKCG